MVVYKGTTVCMYGRIKRKYMMIHEITGHLLPPEAEQPQPDMMYI